MVTAAPVVSRVLVQGPVDLHHAFLLGIRAATAADEAVYALYRNRMRLKQVQHHLFAEWKLVIGSRISQQLGSIVEDTFCKYRHLIVEDADLGACRTRIDDQKSHVAKCTTPLCWPSSHDSSRMR